MSIWSILIPIGLKLFELFLDKSSADAAMKKKFYEFAEKLSGEYLNSVKLRDSYKRQLEELKNANP